MALPKADSARRDYPPNGASDFAGRNRCAVRHVPQAPGMRDSGCQVSGVRCQVTDWVRHHDLGGVRNPKVERPTEKSDTEPTPPGSPRLANEQTHRIPDLMIAQILLLVMAFYLLCGLVFAIPFVAIGVGKIDPHAAHGSWGFRLLIIPGTIFLWPMLASRWLRGSHEPPEERNAHRCAARQEWQNGSPSGRPLDAALRTSHSPLK